MQFSKNKICELVSYNSDATTDDYISSYGYGDPWQLIYVFDGDTSTNVVCEGYSKAFQYLCDLSTFSDEDIICYTVTGTLSGGTGSGGHMWNVVTMDDEKNYLVDVTNSDTGTVDSSGSLFLAGTTLTDVTLSDSDGNTTDSFEYTIGTAAFTYDKDTVELYGTDDDSILRLASYNYKHTHKLKSYTATDATCTAAGNIAYWSCSICGRTFSDSNGNTEVSDTDLVIAKTAHTYGEWSTTKAATCTASGTKTRTCSACGATDTETIAATGHSYAATVTAPTCTAKGYTTHTCSRCGSSYQDTYTDATGHSYGDWTETEAATCTATGTKTRTCTACQTQETETIAALGHNYSTDWTVDKEATCTTAGSKSHHCTRCSATADITAIPVTAHSYDDGKATTAASCTKDGVKTYTCSVCGATKTEAITKLGHSYGDWTETKAATCAETGTKTKTCSICGAIETEEIAKLAHTYGSWTTTKAATCTASGTKTRTCSACGATDTETIAATGHSYAATVTAPTCTAKGYTTHTCSRCGDTYKDTYTSATGHKTTVKNAKSATCTAAGYSGDTVCTVCGKTTATGKSVAAIGHSWDSGKTTTAATTISTGVKTYTCKTCGATKTETIAKLPNPFKDVFSGDYYETPVLWAVSKGITTGMTATTFEPNTNCTRGQIVTFLYRAAGEPEPTSSSNPFKDVKSDDYYYKAVLWAVANGITTGTSATTFSPSEVCTRAQAVTFLWRAHGEESVSASNPFTDVSAGAYYNKAVLWAVANEITNGTSATTFSPNNTCTRGQIVTFLYRAAN